PRSPGAPRARHQTTTHNPRPRPLQPEPHRQHPPTPVEPRPHRRHPARPDRTEAAPERSRSPETPRHHGHVRNPPTPCTTSWNDWGSRVFDERSKPGSRRILMPTLIFRRLCGMAAVPVLMLGLSACTIHSQADPDEVAVSLPGAHEAVIAAYDGLADEPFTIKTSLEVNELDFIDQSTMVDGDSRTTTQDTYMSVIHEISGSDYSDDPEMAELMKSQFADLQMEAIVVDEIA